MTIEVTSKRGTSGRRGRHEERDPIHAAGLEVARTGTGTVATNAPYNWTKGVLVKTNAQTSRVAVECDRQTCKQLQITV